MDRVALVVLDTLRKDLFDEHFDWLPGRRFERAFSTANWTAPVHASMFTGTYPSEHGVHAKSQNLSVDASVLPELLSDAGYTTRALSANPNVSKQLDWDRGFDEFVGSFMLRNHSDKNVLDWDAFESEHGSEGIKTYLSALSACVLSDYDTIPSLERGYELKRKGRKNVRTVPDDGAAAVRNRVRGSESNPADFLFVNLMEAHTPYYPPPEYRSVEEKLYVTIENSLGLSEPDPRAAQAYEDAVRYLSDVYEDIFTDLRAQYDYVITLADHGELLGEHGVWNHTYGLFPELTHVPLVISGDGLTGTERATVSLLDIHRTILDMAGVSTPSRGQNLLGTPQSCRYLVEYHGLIPVALQRIEESDLPADRVTYYDTYRSGLVAEDYYGYELGDDFVEVGSIVDKPRAEIDAMRDSLTEADESDSEVDVSDATVDRLEELGYL